MGKVSGCRMLGGVVLLGAVTLAGCGGSKSSSTTGAAATQTVKRLEVTVVSRSAAVRRASLWLTPGIGLKWRWYQSSGMCAGMFSGPQRWVRARALRWPCGRPSGLSDIRKRGL